MKVFLIRHTTPNIGKGICYGQTDIPLADTYQDELKKLQQKIVLENFSNNIYSSPLSRCYLLAKEFSKNVIIDNRLKELNFGDWEMLQWNAIEQNSLNHWMQDFVNVCTPNGESYVELYKRSVEFIKEKKMEGKNTIVVITHGGIIRSLWSYANNIPLKKSFDLKLNYGDMVRITI